MAARNKASHDYKTRQKIKTTQLVNRLTDHALGKIELSTSQVRSIEVLLRKTLADLSQTTLVGDEDQPLTVNTIELVPLRGNSKS